MMKSIASLLTILAVLAVRSAITLASDEGTAGRAHVGEIRAFAVARSSVDAVVRLEHEGWIEADGRLLPVAEYSALYKQIGRDWTADGVDATRFAVPDLRGLLRRLISSDNPFGVLGPGDILSAGARKPTTKRSVPPVAYWIFTGQDVTQIVAGSR
jgi:tail collar domain